MSHVIKFQPFDGAINNLLPDPFYYDEAKSHIEPSPDYVISRRDGLVLSRYKDNTWDLTPYATKRTVLIFDTAFNISILSEMKRLTYIFMIYGRGRSGTMPGGASVSSFFYTTKMLAQYANSKAIGINDILKNKRILKNFIAFQNRNSPYILTSLRGLLNTLKSISEKRSGFIYAYDKKVERLLGRLAQMYADSRDQTELIPVSIYAAAAKMRWEHVSSIEPYVQKLSAFLTEFINNDAFGRPSKKLPEKSKYNGEFSTWDDAVAKYGLTGLFEKYGVTKHKSFTSFLNQIQNTCRHLIHQYTGMRERECATLAHDCWLEKSSNMPSRIRGYTSKYMGYKNPQVWITHDDIKRVINLLNAISKPIYEHYGKHLKKRPLIMRTGFMAGKNKESQSYDESVCHTLSNSNSYELSLGIEDITLTQHHLDNELRAVEPDRDWSKHEWIEVGKPWHFAAHQYRRSLAVYALGSGLVSLFAIKEQFGHLLSLITAYYGNGNLSAKRLDGVIDETNHIAKYMASIDYQIKAYGFIKNVYLSEESLFGAGGIHFEKHVIARTPEAREAVMKSAPQTAKKFKNGLLHWHDTPMGGCICSDKCDKYLLPDFFIYCNGCDHSVQKLSKIEKIAEAQYKSAMAWGERMPDSIVHRTEVRKSIALNEYLELLKRKQEKLETV